MKANQHPTDEFLSFNDLPEKKIKLRDAWDKIEKAGFLQELKFLIDESSHAAVIKESYDNAEF